MKKVRILSMALVLSQASFVTSCSDDSTKEEQAAQNQTVDDLYGVIRTVENDLSQGYLLRSANDNERKAFTDILYNIKIATMRLRKDIKDPGALSALYLASQEYDKLHVLEQDDSQLGGLKQQLRLTLDQVAKLQGKTLEGVERILFEKFFDYDLAPFAALTASNKTGWTKKNHNELHYAIAEGSKLNSWLFSPRFDLTNVQNPAFSVKQAINSRGNAYADSVQFMVSTNYEGGDPSKADWDSIQVNRLPDGNGFTVVETETVSLAKYAGKKIVLAFHYDSSTATTYPTWQISSMKLFGSGSLGSAPLNLNGAVVTGANVVPTVAQVCTTNPSAKPLFSYQFNKEDLSTNFSKKETEAFLVGTPYPKYPDTLRFTGYNATEKKNKIGTAWLISKPVNLTGAKDVCLSIAEDIYFPSGGVDLSRTEILLSADYAGDTDKATWRTLDLAGRKAATGTVKGSPSPKANGIMIKTVGFETAENLTVAFRYKTDEVASPWWALADLTVTAIPAGDAPLVVTPVDGAGTPANAGGNRPGNDKPVLTEAIFKGGRTVADTCENLQGGQDVMSHQFLTADLGGDFTVTDPLKNIRLPDGNVKFYPGFIQFNGFNKAGNREGTAWLVSKTLNLTNVGTACLSVAEDIYAAKNGEADLSAVEVLASTDYTGNAETATWKKVDLKGRKFSTGLSVAMQAQPKANAVNLVDVVGADAKSVTIAFRHTTTKEKSVWWGIADVTVREVPKTASDVIPAAPAAPTEPAAPAAPTEPAAPAAPTEPVTPPAPIAE